MYIQPPLGFRKSTLKLRLGIRTHDYTQLEKFSKCPAGQIVKYKLNKKKKKKITHSDVDSRLLLFNKKETKI